MRNSISATVHFGDPSSLTVSRLYPDDDPLDVILIATDGFGIVASPEAAMALAAALNAYLAKMVRMEVGA